MCMMLTYAKEKAIANGLSRLSFTKLDLTYEQGNLADFIVTKSALHHLPDFGNGCTTANGIDAEA